MSDVKYQNVSLIFKLGASSMGNRCWLDSTGATMSDVLAQVGEDGWYITSTLKVDEEIYVFVSRVMESN